MQATAFRLFFAFFASENSAKNIIVLVVVVVGITDFRNHTIYSSEKVSMPQIHDDLVSIVCVGNFSATKTITAAAFRFPPSAFLISPAVWCGSNAERVDNWLHLMWFYCCYYCCSLNVCCATFVTDTTA